MNKDYFRTTSLKIATLLFSKDFELVGVNKITEKTKEFVFLDSPEREELISAFDFAPENDPKMMTDIRKVFVADRTLKEKVYRDY